MGINPKVALGIASLCTALEGAKRARATSERLTKAWGRARGRLDQLRLMGKACRSALLKSPTIDYAPHRFGRLLKTEGLLQ